MSMSITNGIKEDKISFNKNSLLTIAGESLSTGETYEASTGLINKKCDYLKVVGNISVNDDSITTDDFHPVVVLFEIKYEDEEGNHSLIYEHFYPKYQHEVGNKDTYTIIELKNKKVVDINVSVVNNEDYVDSITVDKLQIFYSLIIDEETVQEMINGGGSGEVPVVKDLKVYNIEGNYTIDGYNKSLVLDAVIPEKYIQEYVPDMNGLYLNWEIVKQTTNCDYDTYTTRGTQVVDGVEHRINDTKLTITAGRKNYNYGQKDGFVKAIARLVHDETVFGEATVEIKNSEVKDFYIKSISSADGKLHTSEDVTIELGFLPEQSSCAIGDKFTLQSYDGNGEANNVYGSNSYRTIGTALGNNFTLRGVKAGKVSLYLGDDNLHKEFIFDVVDDADKTIDITTNTGLFEITQAGGQLEVYPRPNYGWHGGFSFSQVSIDGGSVTITDKGDYALITGDKNGRLTLICKPVYGPAVQCEISISGQYPENVKLVTADNIFKVPINGSLMIYAEAGNKPNSNYDEYTWAVEKLDNHADWETTLGYKYVKITGKTEGKIRVSAVRKIDSKFMTSEIVEVVTTLDESGAIYVPYPKYEYEYFVIYRRPEKNNVLWLVEIDDTSGLDRLILKNDTLYSNVVHGNCEEFKLENLLWASQYTWRNNNVVGSSVGELIASNLDIYNSSGELIMNKVDNYYDVDFSLVYDKRSLLVIPADSKYWMLYRRTDQNNKLWLLTIGGEVELNKLTKKSDNRVYTNNPVSETAQYKVQDYYWVKHANWTDEETSPASSVGTIYASNLDIYDENGNLLIAKTDNYDDVDFDAIIYGETES